MKYAPIVPPSGFGTLARYRLGYHFALGQELVRDPVYRANYKLLASNGVFIIVDNGAAEHDVPPFGEVVAVADEIGADEIIMPDVLRDKEATLDVFVEHLDAVPARKRMIVPQGKDWQEWETCLHAMIDICSRFSSIGLPKHLESLPGGRATALRIIKQHRLYNWYHIHMLGAWDNILTEIRAAKRVFPGVRGIDSGIAAALAQDSLQLDRHGPRRSLDWNKPINDYFFHLNVETILAECERDA